jgi:hypothetical protein
MSTARTMTGDHGHQVPQRAAGRDQGWLTQHVPTAGVKDTLRASAALRFSLGLTAVP